MKIELPPLRWQVEPSRWSDLSEPERAGYGEIRAAYGGLDRSGFRRYEVAELCARSVRVLLGVETTIAPAPGSPGGGRRARNAQPARVRHGFVTSRTHRWRSLMLRG